MANKRSVMHYCANHYFMICCLENCNPTDVPTQPQGTLRKGCMQQLCLGTGEGELERKFISCLLPLPWLVPWRVNSITLLDCVTWSVLQQFGNSNPPVCGVRPHQSWEAVGVWKTWILDVALSPHRNYAGPHIGLAATVEIHKKGQGNRTQMRPRESE